jgi:hypothetical protein
MPYLQRISSISSKIGLKFGEEFDVKKNNWQLNSLEKGQNKSRVGDKKC